MEEEAAYRYQTVISLVADMILEYVKQTEEMALVDTVSSEPDQNSLSEHDSQKCAA